MRRARLLAALAVVTTWSGLVVPAEAGTLVGLPAWDRVPTPDAGSGDNQPYGVDALADDDVWAVGYSTDGLHDEPLVERYDGEAWSIVRTPDLDDGQFGSALLAVDAASPTDVWAVGGYNDTGASLIMHWDGAAWTVVAHPTPGTYHRLYGVAAAAPNDVWAVGEISTNGGVTRTHVLHWNGTAWTVVPSPIGPDGGYNRLQAGTVVAPNDVWAVGVDGLRALALRWNGVAWSVVPTPAPPSGTYELAAVSVVSSTDIWAVGDAGADALIMRWNGTAWRVVPAPATPAIEDLDGVVAVTANDAWAVGHDGDTFAVHWNGVAWSTVPSENRPEPNFLRAVSAAPDGDVIAVGEGDFTTLVERWDGTSFVMETSADRGAGFNQLLGVHAAAPDDVWAVGTASGSTLTQHWDGTVFSIVASPSVAGRDNVLEDVDGAAGDDVWAVGHHDDPDFIGSRTLALHWNGVAWSIVATPNRGSATDRNLLLGIAALAPDDAWAVGALVTSQSSSASILHWDGTAWRPVRNRCGTSLSGITAFSPADIWAVGGLTFCHWDGVSWTPIPVAPSSTAATVVGVVDIDGASSEDLWAAGSKAIGCGEGTCVSGAIQHWDGSHWVDLPVGPPPLTGVDAFAADDVWAVGLAARPALWHYDGQAWGPAPEPDIDGGSAELNALEGTGPDDIWAAGTSRSGTLFGSTLVLHARSANSGAIVGDVNVAQAVVSWFGPETGSVQTDSFGDYQVGGLTTGRYTFIASAPGCNPVTATFRVQTGTTSARNLPLVCG